MSSCFSLSNCSEHIFLHALSFITKEIRDPISHILRAYSSKDVPLRSTGNVLPSQNAFRWYLNAIFVWMSLPDWAYFRFFLTKLSQAFTSAYACAIEWLFEKDSNCRIRQPSESELLKKCSVVNNALISVWLICRVCTCMYAVVSGYSIRTYKCKSWVQRIGHGLSNRYIDTSVQCSLRSISEQINILLTYIVQYCWLLS